MTEPAADGDRRVTLPRPERPYDLRVTFRAPSWGPGDPLTRLDPERAIAWRATRTPDGPASYRACLLPDAVVVDAWGEGADWVAARASALVGLDDDGAGYLTDHPALRDLARRYAGAHLPRSGTVFEHVVPAVIHQLVQSADGRAWCRALARRLGEPAPGPGELWLYPTPRTLRHTAPHVLTDLGILRKQAETLRRAAEGARFLEALAGEPPGEATLAALQKIRGVGPWTANKVLWCGFGWADAVPVGDFHAPNGVAWALAGEARGDDARMLELLEPFRPHRGRVVQWLEVSGTHAPKFGPRLPRRTRM